LDNEKISKAVGTVNILEQNFFRTSSTKAAAFSPPSLFDRRIAEHVCFHGGTSDSRDFGGLGLSRPVHSPKM
jgi:hypothetical protein